jgi:hypothetical protein
MRMRVVYVLSMVIGIAALAGCGAQAAMQRTAAANSHQESSMLVDDPAVYQRLYQKIQRAVFIRQGLKANSPASAAQTTPTKGSE